MPPIVNIMWFRRDLRLGDNAALYHALRSKNPVLPIFIFDRYILDNLDNKSDRRVEFIHDALQEMQANLTAMGSTMFVQYGFPETVFKDLLSKFTVGTVFTNHDYEPYASERDTAIKFLLEASGTGFETFKDQVILEKNEVLKDDGKPYSVFSPFSRKWKSILTDFHLKPYPTRNYFKNLLQSKPIDIPSLESMGFKDLGQPFPSREIRNDIISTYKSTRDYPAVEGTSRMSVHLRFGTVSVRQVAREASNVEETFLNELIWRDFYQMILWHFPQVGKGRAFKPEYEAIKWRNNETEFAAWCEGRTGYPIVDAGMHELNETGFMHNRVRMITASFLVKHLLIDWRWGEAYFAGRLIDFDLASNNGGWQWAAGSGCDAAPYFRVFSPSLQTKKFDPQFKYIRKWLPGFEGFDYPGPIVEHDMARKRAIDVYAEALKKT